MYYYIFIKAKNCEYQVLINGFPVLDINAQKSNQIEKPINLFLIGINKLSFSMQATEKDTSQDPPIDDISKILFEIQIKKYEIGGRTGPGNGEIIDEFDYSGKNTGSFIFENDKFDFSRIIVDTPVINNLDAIRSYGVYLFNLTKKRKFNKFIQEFEPKIIDTAIAFYQEKDTLEKNFRGQLKSKFFDYPNEVDELFNKDITPLPFCENRIYKLVVGKNTPLIWAYSNREHTGKRNIHVFVAMVNSELKVVR